MSIEPLSRRTFLRNSALLVGGTYGLTSIASGANTSPKDNSVGHYNLSGPAPHLFFHYMAWFAEQTSATDPKKVWTHWSWSGKNAMHTPDNILPNGQRDIASVDYPLIGTYNTWSPDVLRYHLLTAKAAGAQGFIADWSGPGSTEDSNMSLLMDEAHKAGMKISLMYEEKINFAWPAYRDLKSRADLVPAVIGDMNYIYDRYISHPAYLRRNGQPVVMKFDGYGQGALGQQFLTPDEWVQVQAKLPERFCFVRQDVGPSYSASTRGAFFWWKANIPQVLGFNAMARKAVSQGQIDFFASMICPQFNDTGVWGWGGGPRVTPPEGLSLLRDTFVHSLPDDPELIQIVTWNDFNEGTVMEPTRENGFWYLDALATWWNQRLGHKTDLQAIRAPFLEYTRTCSPDARAELPQGSYDTYLAPRPLDVTVPNYLDVLAAKEAQKP